MLTLSSQSSLIKQDSALIEQDSALIEQDLAEDLSAFTDWPGLQKSASIEEDSDEFMFQPRKWKAALNQVAFEPLDEIDAEIFTDTDIKAYSDAEAYIDTEDDSSEISTESDEFCDIFEDYSAPSFKFPSNCGNKSTDSQFKWIILWIMNFRIKFNLLNTATEALLKFISLVLLEVGVEFEPFCSSLYTANQSLGISDSFIKFVAYKKYYKLYKVDKVEKFQQNNQIIMIKCIHIEFPNLVTKCKICSIVLSTQSKLLNSSIMNKPELIFPFATIQ